MRLSALPSPPPSKQPADLYKIWVNSSPKPIPQYQTLVGLNIRGLVQLVSNFGETAGQLSGPVGIVRIGADLVANDGSSVFWFTALISINLAILNILPLPALDGGQLLFLGIEAVRGRRLPKILEERVMQTGLVFLLGLGVILIFKDTLSIFEQ
ncbi:MAG: hypothetical protein HC926_05490 [Synechococcaceae cyanobacterium SM2_3_60]|nr:hypothetical protein [Synechococcaceae cyanobacterium SM2_3_60]